MADKRFFRRRGPFTLGEIAERCGAETPDHADPDRRIVDVAGLGEACAADVTHFEDARLAELAARTSAAACVVAEKLADRLPAATIPLIAPQPAMAWAVVATMFYPEDGDPGEATLGATHVAPGAHVAEDAELGPGVRIGAGAVLCERAKIGAGARIGPGAVIGEGVEIGAMSRIGANASITHALIGCRVIVHQGAAIGQDGFGFAMGIEHRKVPQLGRVIIEDGAEIGANTTIDRGASGDTVIGAGAKIDNLVQIGHNCRVGQGCVIIAQSGLAGSARLGSHVLVAAQSGVAGHLEVGPGARLAARSAVIKDLPGGQDYGGAPARPAREWRRELAAIRRLGRPK